MKRLLLSLTMLLCITSFCYSQKYCVISLRDGKSYVADIEKLDSIGFSDIVSVEELNNKSYKIDDVSSVLVIENINNDSIVNKELKELAQKKVDCYGDSLTDFGEWVSRLQELLGCGYLVRNYGIYGQAPDKITYRQGSVPFLVKADVTIPSSGSVDIVFNRWQGDTATLPNINTSHPHSNVNPVSICGVEGELVYDGGYKFIRKKSGATRDVKAGSVVRTHGYKDKGDITIIWMGTNVDIADESNFNYAINLIKKATECVANGKYIVVGLHAPRTDYGYNISIDNIKEFNATLKKEYGYKFVDQLEYMSKYSLAELGLTPTPQDIQDMSEGKVPHQIMDASYLHYNENASILLGDLFYNIILENGFCQ